MLKLIRNGIMKRSVLVMAAFVSESPVVNCLSSCSPPFFGLFPQTRVDGFSPDTPPSWHLCSQVFSFLITSMLFSPYCCNLNFLIFLQVWSSSPFCHKGALEWLQAMWSESEIYVQMLGLLSCQGPPSPLPLGYWEFLLWTLQSLLVTWFL